MTLINDSLDMVKASILTAVKDQLVQTYPVEFGDYTNSKGSTVSKVFWSDTSRFKPMYPYCMLTVQKDKSEGLDEIFYEKVDGVLKKVTVSRSHLIISIDVFDMGNEDINKTSLEADNFAHKVARQLRKYFNGDEKLEWFAGNQYYPHQISAVVEDDISSIIDWVDTDTLFRYSFDLYAGWDDRQEVDAVLAEGIFGEIYDESKEKIDEFYIKINPQS